MGNWLLWSRHSVHLLCRYGVCWNPLVRGLRTIRRGRETLTPEIRSRKVWPPGHSHQGCWGWEENKNLGPMEWLLVQLNCLSSLIFWRMCVEHMVSQ